MTDQSQNNDSTPTPEELRDQVEETREELGETVAALTAKSDVKAQAHQKATMVKSQIQEKAAHALHVAQDKTPQQVREKAAHAKQQLTETAHVLGDKIQDRTSEPTREKAYQVAQSARSGRSLLMAAAVGALAVVFFVRRSRRC
ncbi:DUF3618 domain-containing protein [Streptomyces sp. NPDC002187]|uniref:DUF3618 domain-containing protein n=1 Tax=Streptomyces sp. NPDC002187 TaxID=3364637 RepID=UPI0036B19C69